MLLCKLSLEYKDEYQDQNEVGRIKILYVSYVLTLIYSSDTTLELTDV
jgi:hypothetical protein